MWHEATFVALAIILVLILLLSIPVRVRGRFRFSSVDEEVRRRIRLTWLFGMVGKDITPGKGRAGGARTTGTQAPRPTEDRAQGEPHEVKAPSQETSKEQRMEQGKRAWHIASTTDGFGTAVKNLVRRSLRAGQVDMVDVHARFGTGDPADTGRLYGYVTPAQAALSEIPRTHVQVQPDFYDDVIETDARGSVSAVPLVVAWAAVAFALTPAVWRAGWRYWRSEE